MFDHLSWSSSFVSRAATKEWDETFNCLAISSSSLDNSIINALSFSPPQNCHFMFCDGAFGNNIEAAAIGGALFDPSKKLINGFGMKVAASSPFCAEAFALREACRLLQANGISNAVIFSDCKSLVSIISADLEPPWEIEVVIKDIKFLSSNLSLVWQFIPRRFNSIAHELASEALQGHLPSNWFVAPPVGLSRLFGSFPFF